MALTESAGQKVACTFEHDDYSVSLRLAGDSEFLENLVLYVPVKVSWSAFAGQHVISQGEEELRVAGVAEWRPAKPVPRWVSSAGNTVTP